VAFDSLWIDLVEFASVATLNKVLDITPLRSFVAVSDCGGFQRAAATLYLSQAAVSQHVRRLEAALGRPLVERQGRGSIFTADGERLLQQARQILDAHDQTLLVFDVEESQNLRVGSTEHAADRVLPRLRQALMERMPGRDLHFRVDRGAQLRDELAKGRLDMALLFGPAESSEATSVGELDLTWYASPGWAHSPGATVPIVAFDNPCAIRTRATETLEAHGIHADVTCEAPHLLGVQAACRAGIGIALMATPGQPPEGLVRVQSLPAAEPIELFLWARQGFDRELSDGTARLLRDLPEPELAAALLPQAA
jgi:DNA-binding transcriptional LysR family regulator